MKKVGPASATEMPKESPRPVEAPGLVDTGISEGSIREEALTLPTVLEQTVPRRKISANPTAGEVHRREQGAPWRSFAEEETRLANEKAREEQAEKRRWGLAKQVQDGLVHTFGINYGIAELAALLKEGISMRRQGKEETTPNDVAYVQLLVAAEKYDLKLVVGLLGKFPKGRNAGGQKAKTRSGY